MYAQVFVPDELFLIGLLLSPFDIVMNVNEDTTSLTLHLDEDLGQGTFTDLLQLGQHASAEHDLGEYE